MINCGDILRDQTGEIMEKGEGVCFLVMGLSNASENEIKPKEGKFQVMEIGDEGFPMGPISFVHSDNLSKMKLKGNLSKMVFLL